MNDSTHSDDRLPSPDLSSLILEDYSQKLGCSPPMTSVINLDQNWVLNLEGSPAADEHGSHKSNNLKLVASKGDLCVRSKDEAGVSGMSNSHGSCMFGGSEVENGNGVEKIVISTEAGADSVADCGEVGNSTCSRTVVFDAEANNTMMVTKESLHSGKSGDVHEDSKVAAFDETRATFFSNSTQESEVLYTCVGALVEEKSDCVAVKEEHVGTSGSSDEDGDSEVKTDSDTGSSESDTSSSSSDDDDDDNQNNDDHVEVDENIEVKGKEDAEGEGKGSDLLKRPECTMKNKDKKHQDNETDGFELEDVNFSSEEEMETGVKGPIKSRNELDVLPPVPRVEAVLLPYHQTLPVGVVSSKVGSRVIIDGNIKHDPLNEGSILWITETRAPLGFVDEIFGPVKNPYYIVRYNSEEDISLEVHVGTSISSVAEFSTNILNQSALYKKGYDASGENDEELDEEVEFSDDEKEAEYRRSLRQQKRGMNGQSHGNQDWKKNQHRRADFQKRMPEETIKKEKKAIPGPSISVQQQSPPVTSDSNAVRDAQAPKNFLGMGSITVPTVCHTVPSASSLGAQPNLLSPINSPWNAVLPASVQNAISGNLMMNGTITQPGNSVMQGGMAPLVPPPQLNAGFLGGLMMNTLSCQPMLPPYMQSMGPAGGLVMNTTPFQLPAQQLGSAPGMLFQNQHQALQQQQQHHHQQQQQLLMSQFPHGFPTQPQFIPNQAPNMFSQNGQINPSLGSMCFEPLMQNTSMQAPFSYDNTSIVATNMNNRVEVDRNSLPTSSNNICPPTQFHMGTSSVHGRGAPFPRAKHHFGKRRP